MDKETLKSFQLYAMSTAGCDEGIKDEGGSWGLGIPENKSNLIFTKASREGHYSFSVHYIILVRKILQQYTSLMKFLKYQTYWQGQQKINNIWKSQD